MPGTTATREGQRPQASDEEAWLARRAAAGDGAAFTRLYDRYERRAYNLCYRITGSRDDAADATQETFVKVLERLPHLTGRELQFGPYLLRAARHASYDAIARRRRAAPSAEIPDSAVPVGSAESDPDRPERGVLLEAHQQQIRAANETLPPRQREALALRELEELSYDEIAEIMGMNRNSVAQLISRARIGLRDGLRRSALGSIASHSPECERALPLLALRQDGAPGHDAASTDWLARHLAACAICPARVAAMEEAGAAYRLWLPLAPALWLRGETIAHAGERVGADWSEFAAPGTGPEPSDTGAPGTRPEPSNTGAPSTGPEPSDTGAPGTRPEPSNTGAPGQAPEPSNTGAPRVRRALRGVGAARSRRARRRGAGGGAVVLVLLAAGLAVAEAADAPEATAPVAATVRASSAARPALAAVAHTAPEATDRRHRERAAPVRRTPDSSDPGRPRAVAHDAPARQHEADSPRRSQDGAPAGPEAADAPGAVEVVDPPGPDTVDEPPGPGAPDDDSVIGASTCEAPADRPPPTCSDQPCPAGGAPTRLPDRGDARPPCPDRPCRTGTSTPPRPGGPSLPPSTCPEPPCAATASPTCPPPRRRGVGSAAEQHPDRVPYQDRGVKRLGR